MTEEINLDDMFAEMDRAADRAEQAMNGRFAQIYKELRSLTPEDVDITPDASDQKEYERLMALVQEASRRNIQQAELVEGVKRLGKTALKIAAKVPSLAKII